MAVSRAQTRPRSRASSAPRRVDSPRDGLALHARARHGSGAAGVGRAGRAVRGSRARHPRRDGRRREDRRTCLRLRTGRLPPGLPPAFAVFPARRARAGARRRPLPRAASRFPLLVRELPRKLVAHPAPFVGAWPAITLRHASSSVAPVLANTGAPCVLAWLGAREP